MYYECKTKQIIYISIKPYDKLFNLFKRKNKVIPNKFGKNKTKQMKMKRNNKVMNQ